MDNESTTATHWASINEKGAVLGIKTMFIIYKYCGRLPFYVVLIPVIAYFFLMNRNARLASKNYLSRLRNFGVVVGAGPLLWLCYRQFYSFGCSLLDKLAVWTGKITIKDLVFYDYDEFESCNSNKTGVLIIGSHLGNIEVCRALARQKDVLKLNVLVHTRHAQKFNSVMREINDESDINLIQVTEIDPATAMLLNEKLSKGEHVVIAGDRTPLGGGNICAADFFGSSAPFPKGPLILASILRCPVFTLFCLKEGNRYGFYMEKLFDRVELNRKHRDHQLAKNIQQYANQLQKYCAQAPLQWYNFYPFWDESGSTRAQGNE